MNCVAATIATGLLMTPRAWNGIHEEARRMGLLQMLIRSYRAACAGVRRDAGGLP
jgi:hypothetical protein